MEKVRGMMRRARVGRLVILRLGAMLAFPVIATVVLARANGSLLLVGGGAEDYRDWSDEPYRWLVEHSGNGTVLVMHYSPASSFLPAYFQWLGGVGFGQPRGVPASGPYKAHYC